MILYLKYLILILVQYSGPANGGRWTTTRNTQSRASIYPLPFKWRTWADLLTHEHLRNMTAELLKDTILKLTHAKKLQEFYEGSITYELGTISAGIREKYMEMVKIYKENANVSHFRLDSSRDTVTNSLHQLAIVQGNYMEIKQEFQMFTAIVEAYERKALEQQKRLNKKSGKSRLRTQIGRTASYSNIRGLTEKKNARRYKDIWEEDWKIKHEEGDKEKLKLRDDSLTRLGQDDNKNPNNEDLLGRFSSLNEKMETRVKMRWRPKADGEDDNKRNRWKSGVDSGNEGIGFDEWR